MLLKRTIDTRLYLYQVCMSIEEVARLLPPASESPTKRLMYEVGVYAHAGRFEAQTA